MPDRRTFLALLSATPAAVLAANPDPSHASGLAAGARLPPALRVLVVGAPDTWQHRAASGLPRDRFHVYATGDEDAGVDLGRRYRFDAILLGSGRDARDFQHLRYLRIARVRCTVLVVADRFDVEAATRSLGLGADDFVHAGHSTEEIVSRIDTSLARPSSLPAEVRRNVVLDPATRTATVDGRRLHLTGREYRALLAVAGPPAGRPATSAVAGDLAGHDEVLRRFAQVLEGKLGGTRADDRVRLAVHARPSGPDRPDRRMLLALSAAGAVRGRRPVVRDPSTRGAHPLRRGPE